jgi:hypothetical protein
MRRYPFWGVVMELRFSLVAASGMLRSWHESFFGFFGCLGCRFIFFFCLLSKRITSPSYIGLAVCYFIYRAEEKRYSLEPYQTYGGVGRTRAPLLSRTPIDLYLNFL